LASPDAFRAAGLQFNNSLAGLRMAVEERGGRYFVKISSNTPINEPFVDLMVELNWASGKFVREYTFLLDPPELRASRQTVETGAAGTPVVPAASARATPVAPAASSSDAATAAARAAAVRAAQASQAAQAASAGQGAVGASGSGSAGQRPPAATRRPTETAAAAPARSPAPATPAVTSDSVTVRAGDTLGKIAESVRPANATLEQTIIAIYTANRSAFIENNPNLIRQGRTLTIPDASTIAAIDAGAAQRQLRVAARDFRSYKDRLAGGATEVASATTGTTASGSVSARVEDGSPRSSTSDRLELSRSTTATGQAGAVGSRDAEAQIARTAALNEANSRVADLERNVADLQRMLELKNRSLADLQAQLDQQRRAAGASVSGAVGTGAASSAAGSPSPAAAAAPSSASSPSEASSGTSPSSTTSPSAMTSPSAAASSPSATAASSPSTAAPSSPSAPVSAASSPSASGGSSPSTPSATAPSTSPSLSSTDGLSATTPATPSAPTPPTPAAPATPPMAQAPAAPPVEESLLDGLMDNPIVLPALGGLALLGGFGLWMAMRRRKVEKFEDSLVAADAFTANSLFGTTGGQSVDTATGAVTQTQVSTLSDASPTEVDPIAEADVYIAYGREAQAEEILKEALKRQPERQAIRLKLMEIYSGRKDAQAFEAMARDMHAMTGGDNEEWPKVATMGLALDPSNALYTSEPSGPAPDADGGAGQVARGAAAATVAATAGAAASRPQDASAEASFEAPTFENSRIQAPATPAAPAADAMADLDFNLDLDKSLTSAKPAAQPAADFSDSIGFPPSKAGPLAAMPNVELPSLDLDLPQYTPAERKPARTERPSGPAAPVGGGFDVDVPALETLTKRPAPVAQAEAQEMDLSAIGLDLSPSTISGPATMAGAGSGQWQEMASKLDLASAYGEIGDKEGARELLQEVVRGGDPAQQQRARELLASI
ncbi:MAG: FimV/HubP family polar landmark protein, partial [Lautropia sp.]